MKALLPLCTFVAAVVSVDISAAARGYLLGQGWSDVWVTDVYYT